MARNKIALIGAGNIGGLLGIMTGLQGISDLVIMDINASSAMGKGLDAAQAMALFGKDVNYNCGSDYALIQDADVVIVTAGIARKPGMSRNDLLKTNSQVIQQVGQGIKQYAPNAFVICVTNPLDAMVYLLQKSSGLPANKVCGMAGVLDAGRFKYFLSQELKVSVQDIKTMVLGGHGDDMVPLIRYTTIGGVPLPEVVKLGWLTQEKLDEIIQRTRQGGAEIVNLLQTGSAFAAPAAAILSMINAYLFDQRRILPCAALLHGEYGVTDLYVGVPVILGSKGVECIVELNLNQQEQEMFTQSVNSVRLLLQELEAIQTE